MQTAACRGSTGEIVRSRPLLLAACISFGAASPQDSALAQATNVDICTRAFGGWVAQRDAQLQRLEGTPTLLGLDNTWCTSSLARIAELRSNLEGVRAMCASVTGGERARVDSLVIRAALQLDKVKFCAPQVVVADAEPDPSWETSVRTSPKQAKPVAEKRAAEVRPAEKPAAPIKPEKPVVSARGEKPVAPAWSAAEIHDTQAEATKPEATKATAAKVEPAKAPVSKEAPKEMAAAAPHRQTERADTTTPPPATHTVGAQIVASTSTAQSAPPAADEGFDGLKRYAVQAETRTTEDEDCLVVTKTSPASYLIENRNCRPQVILAAIELSRPGQAMRCFTKKVADGIAIAGEGGSPQINFQCREGTQGCAEGMLRGMFPECQPG